jgi:hypothetical protein
MSKNHFWYRKKPRSLASCQVEGEGITSLSRSQTLRPDRVDQGFLDALYRINPDGGGVFIGKGEGGLDIVLAIRPDDFKEVGLRWGVLDD